MLGTVDKRSTLSIPDDAPPLSAPERKMSMHHGATPLASPHAGLIGGDLETDRAAMALLS